MTLRQRLMLASLLVAIVPLVGLSLATYSTARHSIEAQALRHLARSAAVQRDRIEQFVEEQHERLALVASRTALRVNLSEWLQTEGDSARDRMIRIVTDAAQSVDSIRRIDVISPDGYTVASTDPTRIGFDHTQRPGYDWIEHTTTSLLDRVDGQLYLDTFAVLELDGRKIGRIMVRSTLDELLAIASDGVGFSTTQSTIIAARDTTGAVTLLTPAGNEPGTRDSNADATGIGGVAMGLALGGQAVVLSDTVDQQGTPVFAATQHVASQGWGLVVKINRSEALAGVGLYSRAVAVVTILCLVVILVSSFITSRTITRPLKHLSQTAVAIADGDTERRANLGGPLEVWTVASAFNGMADHLTNANDRLQVESAERTRSEARFRHVVEHAPSAMVMVDAQGVIVLVNAEAERVFRYEREELIGQAIEVLVPTRFQVSHPERTTSFFEHPDTRAMGAGRDLYALRKDREEIPVEIGLNPIETEEGVFVLASIVDITERRQFVESLCQKNEEMERFVYTVSHDLKSPVVTIRGYIGMMKRELATGNADSIEEMLARVERGAERLVETINALLGISRLGRVVNEPEHIHTAELVGDLVSDLAERILDTRAVVQIEDDLPPLYADPTRVREVFDNLLCNALKYGSADGAGPEIRIGGERHAEEVRLFVSDNGPGIEAEYSDKVFALFERLRTDSDGTGIGLAIVKRIMELHGGRVWLESSPGNGATFWLAFPKGSECKRDEQTGGCAFSRGAA